MEQNIPSGTTHELKFDPAAVLAVACAAAEAAQTLVRNARRTLHFDVGHKVSRENNVVNKNDVVTSADRAAEQCIVDRIRSSFPSHRILGEESAPTVASADVLAPTWIIDPIDGTTNFIRGHRHVAISIAFAVAGRVECGVVAAPFLDELFTSVRGQGAFLNGTRLAPIVDRPAADAVVALGYPHFHPAVSVWQARLAGVMEGVRDVRRLGAAALDLCFIAAGRVDGFWETLHPWDVAAGMLVCREVGALVERAGAVPPRYAVPDDFCGYELMVGTPSVMRLFRAVAAAHPAGEKTA